jgi:type IV secretion system protein VirD4
VALFALLVALGYGSWWLLRVIAGALRTVLVDPLRWLLGMSRGTHHGSARWARPGEIRKHWLSRRGPIYLGHWRDAFGRDHALTRGPGEHVLLVAPSRGGKGVGVHYPDDALLAALCIDP